MYFLKKNKKKRSDDNKKCHLQNIKLLLSIIIHTQNMLFIRYMSFIL